MPLVSVVLPTYNRANVLSRAVNSVLNQTFRDFELIIVDDASTDNTRQLLASYDSTQICVISLPDNVGPAGARNAGIRAASGALIAFQDSDDEWGPEKLSIQVPRLISSSVSLGRGLGASYSRFLLQGRGRFTPFPPLQINASGNIYKDLLEQNLVGTPTLMVSREVLQDIGEFDEKLSWLEDWDLALRIAQGYDFDFVDSPLLVSYRSPGGVNQRDDPIAVFKIHQKHLGYYRQSAPDLGAWRFLAIGDSLMKRGYPRLGQNAFGLALALRPNMRTVALRVATLGGQRTYCALANLFGKRGILSSVADFFRRIVSGAL